MAYYIQHGHGKGNKIETAITNGYADGVILSARNEHATALDSCIDSFRGAGDCQVLLDPQFYISTFVPPNDRFLPEDYTDYYESGRTANDFIRLSNVSKFAKSTIDFQARYDLNRILSPTVLVNGFTDRWSQISLQLADRSAEYHASLNGASPLLVSLVLSEGCFDSRSELDGFLDVITGLDVQGFYLVVVRDDSTYSQSFYDERLCNLMYLVYVLANRNEFEVVCGYSDFSGFNLRAAGAQAIAGGWYQSLRQCHQRMFLKQKPGGQPARLRYSSGPLLNSIMLSELESIYLEGLMDKVLSDVPLDEVITSADSPEASSWSLTTSEQHHWQTLQAIESTFDENVRKNLVSLLAKVRKAKALYTELVSAGIPFDRNTKDQHLNDWEEAIKRFQQIAQP
jgi:hypothetical protein